MKKLIILILTISTVWGLLSSCKDNYTSPESHETINGFSEYPTTESVETTPKSADETITKNSTHPEDVSTDISTNIEDMSSGDLMTTLSSADNTDYTVVNVGNQWYLQCDNYNYRGDNTVGIFFDSMEEFKNCLDIGLHPADLDYIKMTFQKTATGIKILDFNNLYYPDLPNGVEVLDSGHEHIEWVDSFTYSLLFAADDNSLGGIFAIIMNENDYDQIYNRDRFNEYILQDSEKQITVSRKERNNNASYQYCYELFIKDTSCYAYVLLNSEKLLSNEFILSFGTEKYLG